MLRGRNYGRPWFSDKTRTQIQIEAGGRQVPLWLSREWVLKIEEALKTGDRSVWIRFAARVTEEIRNSNAAARY
jgi:hypothetical protein